MITKEQIEEVFSDPDREAMAWYVKYDMDAYALGPLRYDKPVTPDVVMGTAFAQFGEYPQAIWPTN